MNELSSESKKHNPSVLINQAKEIVTVFTLKPMKSGQRIVLTSIYTGLFIIPLIFVAPFAYDYYKAYSFYTSQAENYQYQLEQKQTDAKKQSFEKLVRGVAHDGLKMPVSEQDLLEAQARLGQTIPDELKALYQVSNGIEDLGIAPLQDLKPASQISDWEIWGESAGSLELLKADGGISSVQIDALMSGWLYVGSHEQGYHAYLYRLGQPKQNEGRFLECSDRFCVEHVNLREWLEDYWASLSL